MRRALVLFVLLGSVQRSPVCGTEHIIGGSAPPPTQYKWMAAIYRNGDFACGGSLISFNWVITACHCVHLAEIEEIEVVMGAFDITDTDDPLRQSQRPAAIREHHEFDPVTYENDVALLNFPDPFVKTSRTDFIVLPYPSAVFDNLTALLSGWGLVNDDPVEPATELQDTSFPIIDNQYCATIFPGMIKQTNLCTWQTPDRAFCFGDGGDGLVLPGDGFTLIAIVSFSTPNCRSGAPGVYTNMVEYLGFVQSVTDNEIRPRKP